MSKWMCGECSWRGVEEELLRATNPFSDDETDTIIGCPGCREPNTMRMACDENGCWEEGSCGTPTPSGYRHTCFNHRPMGRKTG
jgi:hypothetical protein